MAAAVDTFASQGLAGTSMRDVARRARIRVSSLYHYFPSKEALYLEVQQRWQAEMRTLVVSVLSKGLPMRETTREMVSSVFDHLRANRSIARLGYRMALERGPLPGEADTSNRWLGLAEGFLKPAELAGQVKEIDAVPFMVTMDAVIHGHIVNEALYRMLLGKGFEDADVVQRVREHLIQVAMRTLGLD